MKQENQNYPKVYAPMPLEKIQGHDAFGYPCYHVYAYLAAPCYLISERKYYSGDGTSKMEYEVVFYKAGTDKNPFELEAVTPHFNCDDNCTNSILVTEIQDNYECMKTICKKKSSDLMILNNIHLSPKQLQIKFSDYHDELEHIYEQFEQANQLNPVFIKKK